MRKLPVFKTVKEVFVGVTTHYVDLLIAAWPAVALLALVQFINVVSFAKLQPIFIALNEAQIANDTKAVQEQIARISEWNSSPQNLWLMVLFLLANAIAAVRWHRFVLLGEGAKDGVKPQFLRSEDLSYIWTCIKIGLISIVIWFAVIVLVGGAFWGLHFLGLDMPPENGSTGLQPTPLHIFFMFAGLVAIIFFTLRLMLALPDAAVGQKGRVFKMLAISEINALRLLLGSVIFALVSLVPFVVVLGALSLLGMNWFSPGDFKTPDLFLRQSIIIGIPMSFVYLYFLMCQITFLSVAYREIIGLPGEAAPEPAADDLRIEPV